MIHLTLNLACLRVVATHKSNKVALDKFRLRFQPEAFGYQFEVNIQKKIIKCFFF